MPKEQSCLRQPPVPAPNIRHFAIHADNVERAKTFYEQVFGWRFEAWGPPDFYRVHTGPEHEPGIHGALQKRHPPRLDDQGMEGFECTISVADVNAIAEEVVQAGGSVVMPATEIPTVGTMIKFRDTEGNLACAMQYVEGLA